MIPWQFSKNLFAKGNPMKTRFLLPLGLLIGFAFTAASAQDGYVNSSPHANFSQYHAYAWGQQQNPDQIANSISGAGSEDADPKSTAEQGPPVGSAVRESPF
jgi:hypothetical protein